MGKLTPEERRLLTEASHNAQPLSLVVVGRRGELTILIEDLEELYHYGGMHENNIVDLIWRHIRDVQAEEGGE